IHKTVAGLTQPSRWRPVLPAGAELVTNGWSWPMPAGEVANHSKRVLPSIRRCSERRPIRGRRLSWPLWTTTPVPGNLPANQSSRRLNFPIKRTTDATGDMDVRRQFKIHCGRVEESDVLRWPDCGD